MNDPSFWVVHGIGFILCLAIAPRLTLFICSVILGTITSGGWLWWLGWIFFPRLLIAVLATYGYWDTNPILVVLTWMWALSGEKEEKTAASDGSQQKTKNVGIFSLIHVTTLIPRVIINNIRLWILKADSGVLSQINKLKKRKAKQKETASFGGQLRCLASSGVLE
jgi:hypothetical protein